MFNRPDRFITKIITTLSGKRKKKRLLNDAYKSDKLGTGANKFTFGHKYRGFGTRNRNKPVNASFRAGRKRKEKSPHNYICPTCGHNRFKTISKLFNQHQCRDILCGQIVYKAA